jgi:RNA polymerase sigma-70 factor (ECF subfamily)
LAALCEAYWYPLYAFLRRQGFNRATAEDYTQSFFARMLEKQGFQCANPDRGRFRNFLLAALKHFVANERKRARARKRGGGREMLSLDVSLGEEQYAREPSDRHTPETLYARAWALTLLNRTMARLETTLDEAQDRRQLYLLRRYLVGNLESGTYADAAAELGMSESALKVAIHRLRKRFGRLLRDEIAQTVASPDKIDIELRELFLALST